MSPFCSISCWRLAAYVAHLGEHSVRILPRLKIEIRSSETSVRIRTIQCCIPEDGNIHWHITPWSESASELYRPSDHRLSAKWLRTCADRGCHVVSVPDPSGRIILGFLDSTLTHNWLYWKYQLNWRQVAVLMILAEACGENESG
jgi:hypothetical protein